MIDPVAILLDNLVARAGRWPQALEQRTWERINTWRAFLESDRDALAVVAGWAGDRPYKVDPLADRIAGAWADYTWGEEPTIRPANERDDVMLEFLAEANEDLFGDAHAAERTRIAEGEVWWRIYVDRDVADAPLLEWHGRDEVIPVYVGGRLMAVAYWQELDDHAGGRGGNQHTRWRHFEIHAEGMVEHVLYRGTDSKIGQPVPLLDHPETVELGRALGASPDGSNQVWVTNLPMLMGRIVNRRPAAGGRRRRDFDRHLGISDFAGISDFLLDLNEAVTIAGENARLTAKKRAVIPASATRPRAPGPFEGQELVDNGDGSLVPTGRATFDAGEDLLVMDPLDAELGVGADGGFKVLEYSYDAEALITHKRDLTENAVTRVGITPQWIGVQTPNDGQAVSGTSLRLRLIPTTKTGTGKLRAWQNTYPYVLGLMARVDAMAEVDGGFGRAWASPEQAPIVEFADPLPVDEVEAAQVESSLVGARVKSRRRSVQDQHPDWTDSQVDDELGLIAEDAPASPFAPPAAVPPPGAPPAATG